jgi:hypothetical protein
MEATDPTDEALAFFRALADVNRLRLLGLLARQPHSVEELGVLLGLRPSTISHHLARLAEAELVQPRAEGYYSVYALAPGSLEVRARRWLGRRALRARIADLDLEAYDRKVLRDFSRPDGRLKTIPTQRRKLEAVLRSLVRAFHPDRTYSETQVNRILRRFHPDTATLRRELVGAKLLAREGDGYRRPR